VWQRPLRERKWKYNRRMDRSAPGWRKDLSHMLSKLSPFDWSRWWFVRGFVEEIEAYFAQEGTFELDAGLHLRRVTLFANDAGPAIPTMRNDPRLDGVEWLMLYAFSPNVREARQAVPRDLLSTALRAGLIVYELHLPFMPIKRFDDIHNRFGHSFRRPLTPEALDGCTDRLDRSSGVWENVSRERLRQLVGLIASPGWQRLLRQRPSWRHSRPEIVRRWYGVFLGDLLREANVWAVALSEDRDWSVVAVRCYAIFKPETVNAVGLARLRASPLFHAEHR
jgi:hypothetical protein